MITREFYEGPDDRFSIIVSIRGRRTRVYLIRNRQAKDLLRESGQLISGSVEERRRFFDSPR